VTSLIDDIVLYPEEHIKHAYVIVCDLFMVCDCVWGICVDYSITNVFFVDL